jgi:Na+/H+ antiporter NhaB
MQWCVIIVVVVVFKATTTTIIGWYSVSEFIFGLIMARAK